ncbi:CHAT domain-containing protein [Nostoc sp. UHCC 0702]|nr:CHAT domain-containing protein [Nostoc sp. UHCC 0702]
MRHHPIARRLQRLTLASLAFYLTLPLSTLQLELFITSPVLAESPNAEKAEADRLIKQGYELSDRNQPEAALKAFQQALSIYRQIKNQPGQGKALIAIGNVYSDHLDEFNKAITNYQQALEIAQSIKDTTLEARALSNLGLVYLQLKNSARAIEYCEKALGVARQNKNYETEAIALKSLGAIYFYTDASKGMNFIEQAVNTIRKAGGSPEDQLRQDKLEIDLLNTLGAFNYAIGGSKVLTGDLTGGELLNQSVQYFQDSIKLAKQIGDRTRLAKALIGLGDIYNLKGQYTKAIELYEQALETFKTDNKSPSEISEAFSKLGEVYDRQGEIDKAIESYNQALIIANTEVFKSPIDKLEHIHHQGFIFLNVGNIYSFKAKNYEQALKFYQQALDTFQSFLIQFEKTPSAANEATIVAYKRFVESGIKTACVGIKYTYIMLGRSEESKKTCLENSASPKNLGSKNKSTRPPKSAAELEKARKKLQEALEQLKIYQTLGNPDLQALSLVDIAQAYAELGEDQLAEEYFQKAIEISKTSEGYQVQPLTYMSAGFFYNERQKYDLAISYYKQAGEFAQKGGNQWVEVTSYQQIGITAFIANKLPEATTALYKAINLFDSMQIVLSDPNQISFFDTQTQTYSLLQKVLIIQNQPKQALEVAERARARAFVNLITARQSKNNNQLKANIPVIVPPKLQDIQKIAKEQKATIVEYSIPSPLKNADNKIIWDGSEIYIWVVKPTGEIAFHVQKINISLKDLVSSSRQAIGVNDRSIFSTVVVNPDDAKIQRESLQKLYQLLIKPIAQYLPTNPNERVIFIPQNQLFLVPFAALQDEQDKYLIEKHTILTAPAIQVLQFTHEQRQKISTTGALVVGNPTMPSLPPNIGEAPKQLKPLKNAEDEAIEIAQMLNTKALTGKQATEVTVKQLMTKARIIHLATHGLLDDFGFGVPGAIALAPDSTAKKEQQDSNGFLTAGEIFDMKLNAELVVLSACETGQGTITGDGVIGLSRSLIAAGVPSVVVSLWSVDDKSTKLLMTEFYRQMQQNPNKATALRQAMLLTMKQYPQPKYWAAFTLIGESL